MWIKNNNGASLVAVACFLPGRAKDLSAPPRTCVCVYVCVCVCVYIYAMGLQSTARQVALSILWPHL